MTNKISAGTIARTVVLLLALVNQVLSMLGVQTIPIADENVNTLIATGWTIAASLAAWWKNNSFTQAALAGDARVCILCQKYPDGPPVGKGTAGLFGTHHPGSGFEFGQQPSSPLFQMSQWKAGFSTLFSTVRGYTCAIWNYTMALWGSQAIF